jgi:hypothetical protein
MSLQNRMAPDGMIVPRQKQAHCAVELLSIVHCKGFHLCKGVHLTENNDPIDILDGQT